MNLLLAIRTLIARVPAQNHKDNGRISDALRKLNRFSRRGAQLEIRSLLSDLGWLCGRNRPVRSSDAKASGHDNHTKCRSRDNVLAPVLLRYPENHHDLLYRC